MLTAAIWLTALAFPRTADATERMRAVEAIFIIAAAICLTIKVNA